MGVAIVCVTLSVARQSGNIFVPTVHSASYKNVSPETFCSGSNAGYIVSLSGAVGRAGFEPCGPPDEIVGVRRFLGDEKLSIWTKILAH